MPKTTKSTDSSFPSTYDVTKRVTLNFTDIINNSNKFYNIEIQVSGSSARIFTNYGRVGGTIIKEYRSCDSITHAEKETEKIIKSKTKKGYVEVKLVKADVGSEVGKSKIDSSVAVSSLAKVGVSSNTSSSNLHPQVSSLIQTWFGLTQQFIDANLDTGKCPLGQLSVDQIAKARDILDEAKNLLNKRNITDELNKLTNEYYSNIPHNFGYTRINPDVLRFDKNEKIDKALSLLEVFENNKDFSGLLSKTNAVDEQYKSLNSEINYLESDTDEWKWIDFLVQSTKAHNHSHLGKIVLNRIFKLKRSGEEEKFLKLTEEIAKTSKGRVIPEIMKKAWAKRQIGSHEELYDKANVLPLFHGTRTANMIGITSKGLLVKHDKLGSNGLAYGSGTYKGFSSKALNYSSVRGSYWASGRDTQGYLFLTDTTLGDPKIVDRCGNYNLKTISPCHSVWAQGGRSGVINDEFITFQNNQDCLRYILEIECR